MTVSYFINELAFQFEASDEVRKRQTDGMPKFSFEEDMMRDFIGEADDFDFQAAAAKYKRDENGHLSVYEAASCALDEPKLRETSHLALQELRRLGVTRFVVNYNGGGDEGFAHLGRARTSKGSIGKTKLIEQLQNGPLGEKPEARNTFYSPQREAQLTRNDWTRDALDLLVYELAVQLLGRGYGTGEFSVEGAFVTDLQSNTLTDIAPEDV